MKKIVVFSLALFLLMFGACGNPGSAENQKPALASGELSGDGIAENYLSSINTRIIRKPPNPSHSSTAQFKFACTGGPCTYKCQLDSGAWKKCRAKKTYKNLIAGDHTLMVKASNSNGQSDLTPAQYSWTINDIWLPTSTGAGVPSAREDNTAVWTGTEMIVWGGYMWDSSDHYYNTGGKYNPSTNSWTPTSTGANVPSPRDDDTAVWTGAEMIVWGGFIGSTAYFNTGGRYNPTTDSWTATSTGANVPAARKDHTAVWTGAEMVVWGGDNASYLNTGGRYNPVTNSWTVTSTAANVPSARCFHTAVWTGNEMIIWAGTSGSGVYVNTGARYNPITDSWTPTSTGANVPLGRVNHTAVWTSGLTTPLMIVWGGWYYSGSNIYTNTGGIYNPSSNSWTATSTNAPVPSARIYHTAVWTTGLTTPVMIIWGGYFYDTSAHYYNNGANYNPGTNSWTATSASPAARDYHTAVWSGTQMIVWGGYTSGSTNTNTGGRYNPSLNSWNSTSLINVPDARACHTAVWTGNEMIIWGGSPTNVNSGGRYVP